MTESGPTAEVGHMDNKSHVDISDLLDARGLSGLQIYVVAICALAVLFDGYDIQVMALTIPALSAAWGVAPASFSTVFSASLLGMGIGAATIGPLGDRYGRRTVLAGTLVIVSVTTFLTAFAGSPLELTLLRFATGVGLGGSLPNAFALTADYVPRARRAGLLTMMYCNTATGALLAGLCAPYIIRHFGWQGAFYVGGVLPLLACGLLLATTPESIKFLLGRRPGDPSIRRILARIAPEVAPDTIYFRAPPRIQAGSIRDLFESRYRRQTLLLWISYVMNSFVLYLIVSWLPTLLTGSGWASDQALRAASVNSLGGIIGGLSLGWLMDRFGQERTLAVGFGVGALVLALFLVVPSAFWTWGALLLVIGCCAGGAQFALASLAAALYPSTILATGTGWASAVARIGAVASPLAGGALLAAGVAPTQVFAILAIPALICAFTMILLLRTGRQARELSSSLAPP